MTVLATLNGSLLRRRAIPYTASVSAVRISACRKRPALTVLATDNPYIHSSLKSYSTASSTPPFTNSMKLRPVPFFFTVAAALTFRSHTTFGEGAAYQSRSTPSDEEETSVRPSKSFADCPFYGCPITPQDVHYNTEIIKNAFARLRSVPRIKIHQDAVAESELLQSTGNEQAVTLTLIGYKGGSLNDQVNQDRALIVKPFKIENDDSNDHILLGVFDGHAHLGEDVSDFTKNNLPVLLSKKISSKVNKTMDKSQIEKTCKQILIETFVELDRTAPAEISGGCTASVVLKHQDKVYVANAGDSRSFLVAYRPSTERASVLYISREDKPNLPDEHARVLATGGQVYIPARGTSRVVYHDPRTGAPSGLAMSRSIGDWAAGKLGVIPDPIVDVFDIETLVQSELSTTVAVDLSGNTDHTVDDVHIFAVSATDGMMDYLEAGDIAAVLAKSLYEENGVHPIAAVEHLVFAAANSWQQDKQGRYRDDIAIAVSCLRWPTVTPQ